MVDIKIDAKKLLTALDRYPKEVSRSLRNDMLINTREIASYAKKHHRFKDRSGSKGVEGSIKNKVSQDGLEGIVYLDTGIAPHSPYVHEGTPPHKIKPKNRKALYFVSGGKGFFSKKGVNHPGTNPDQFLDNALHALRKNIIINIQHALDKAYKIARM